MKKNILLGVSLISILLSGFTLIFVIMISSKVDLAFTLARINSGMMEVDIKRILGQPYRIDENTDANWGPTLDRESSQSVRILFYLHQGIPHHRILIYIDKKTNKVEYIWCDSA